MRITLPFSGRVLHVFTRKPRLKPVLGICSLTPDMLHIVMIDYDDCSIVGTEEQILQIIEQDILRLVNKYKLGKFYIFRSSKKKFHAICFSKVTLTTYINILEDSSCDYYFYKGLLKPFNGVRAGVLRLFKKGTNENQLELVTTIRGYPKQHFKQSRAHMIIYTIAINSKTALVDIGTKNKFYWDDSMACDLFKITYGV